MTSDDDFDLRKIYEENFQNLIFIDSKGNSSDAELVNREQHDKDILYYSFYVIQQNWSPIIRDCVSFEEYNQEHRLLTEIDYDNSFSIYKLFVSDDTIF